MPTEGLVGNVPDHVPASLVYDFDLSHDPLFKPDLQLGLIELNKRTPEIFWTPRYGGHWVARSQDAIWDVTHDPATFSSNPSVNQIQRQLLPISADPPMHTFYRKVLLQVFAPKTVNAMVNMIRAFAIELIDQIADTGHCDFVSEVSEPLPVIIFMKILGIPREFMGVLRKLIVEALETGDPFERERVFDRQMVILNPILEARMTKREDDVISQMIDSDIDGRYPTLEEMQNYLLFLTNAGLDTVTNAMSFSAMHVARHLDLQRQVRADPTLIADMVEELLRRYAVSSISRRVTRDLEFRGVQMKKGERIHVLLPAANLDSKIYPEPEKIVLGRTQPPVTFGFGVHRCLGSHLARLEIRTMFEELFRRIPEFRIEPGKEPIVHAGFVYSVETLPLVWTPKE